MLSKTKTAWVVPLVLGVAIGVGITVNLGHQAVAEEAKQADATTSSADAVPRGRGIWLESANIDSLAAAAETVGAPTCAVQGSKLYVAVGEGLGCPAGG